MSEYKAEIQFVALTEEAESRVRQLNAALREQTATTGRTTSAMNSMRLGALAKGLALGTVVAAVNKTVRALISATREYESNRIALEGVVRGLNDLVVSEDEARVAVQGFANELQRSTRFAAGDTLRALGNLQRLTGDLNLSYRELQGATRLAADVAVQMGTDIESASRLVAGALNGQARAMRELGVRGSTTEERMASLARRFEGVAENSNTTTDAVARLSNEWNDLRASVGEFIEEGGLLVTILDDITTGIRFVGLASRETARAFDDLQSQARGVREAFQEATGASDAFIDALEGITLQTAANLVGLGALYSTYNLYRGAVDLMADAVEQGTEAIEDNTSATQELDRVEQNRRKEQTLNILSQKAMNQAMAEAANKAREALAEEQRLEESRRRAAEAARLRAELERRRIELERQRERGLEGLRQATNLNRLLFGRRSVVEQGQELLEGLEEDQYFRLGAEFSRRLSDATTIQGEELVGTILKQAFDAAVDIVRRGVFPTGGLRANPRGNPWAPVFDMIMSPEELQEFINFDPRPNFMRGTPTPTPQDNFGPSSMGPSSPFWEAFAQASGIATDANLGQSLEELQRLDREAQEALGAMNAELRRMVEIERVLVRYQALLEEFAERYGSLIDLTRGGPPAVEDVGRLNAVMREMERLELTAGVDQRVRELRLRDPIRASGVLDWFNTELAPRLEATSGRISTLTQQRDEALQSAREARAALEAREAQAGGPVTFDLTGGGARPVGVPVTEAADFFERPLADSRATSETTPARPRIRVVPAPPPPWTSAGTAVSPQAPVDEGGILADVLSGAGISSPLIALMREEAERFRDALEVIDVSFVGVGERLGEITRPIEGAVEQLFAALTETTKQFGKLTIEELEQLSRAIEGNLAGVVALVRDPEWLAAEEARVRAEAGAIRVPGESRAERALRIDAAGVEFFENLLEGIDNTASQANALFDVIQSRVSELSRVQKEVTEAEKRRLEEQRRRIQQSLALADAASERLLTAEERRLRMLRTLYIEYDEDRRRSFGQWVIDEESLTERMFNNAFRLRRADFDDSINTASQIATIRRQLEQDLSENTRQQLEERLQLWVEYEELKTQTTREAEQKRAALARRINSAVDSFLISGIDNLTRIYATASKKQAKERRRAIGDGLMAEGLSNVLSSPVRFFTQGPQAAAISASVGGAQVAFGAALGGRLGARPSSAGGTGSGRDAPARTTEQRSVRETTNVSFTAGFIGGDSRETQRDLLRIIQDGQRAGMI